MNMNHNYKPIQSGIENFFELNINYRSTKPHPYLQKYIINYFEMNSYQRMHKSFTVRCIPDGCITLMFNKNLREKLFLAGIARKPFFEKIITEPDMFGVKFYPGAINNFFRLPCNDIYDNPLPFEEFVSFKIKDLEEKLFCANTFEMRIEILETFLVNQLENRMYSANPNWEFCMDAIYLSKGSIRVKDLCKQANISDRYLRMLFNTQLGISPKEFIKLVRFQSSYRDIKFNKHKSPVDIALGNGYYDQSHFIKEFKEFSGKTPVLKK